MCHVTTNIMQFDLKCLQESDNNSNGKSTVYGETKIDIAEYASPNHKKTISIPIRCKIKDQTAEIVLKVINVVFFFILDSTI